MKTYKLLAKDYPEEKSPELLRQERDLKVIEGYKHGITSSVLSQKYGCDYTGVLRKHNVELDRRSQQLCKKLEHDKKVLELAKNTILTYSEIGKLCRIAPSNVCVRLAGMGFRRALMPDIIKQRNKLIYDYVLKHEQLTMRKIARDLRMNGVMVSRALATFNYKKPNSSTLNFKKKIPKIKKMLLKKRIMYDISKKLHVGLSDISYIKKQLIKEGKL